MNSEIHNEAHYCQTAKTQTQTEKFESSKTEATRHIQENLNKISNLFLIRNYKGQKAMGIYSLERKIVKYIQKK